MTRPRSTSLSSSLCTLRVLAVSIPLAMGAAFAFSCGSSSEPSGTGGTNTGGSKATGGTTSTGGNTTGGASATGGANNTGGIKATGGNASTGGSATGGSSATGGATGGATSGGGSAGSTGGAPIGGRGGASALGGRGGSNNPATGGGGGSNTATGGTSGGGASGNGQCPTGALFCSGFEDSTLPATLKTVSYTMTGLPTLDKNVKNSGAQSVTIGAKAGGGEMYLEAPAAQTFWFRAYIRTDNGFTHNEHDSFIALAWPGDDKGAEIVEENCMLTVNVQDKTWGSNGMMMQAGCHTDGVRLDANKWYCLEGFADGTKGDLQIYVDKKAAIQISGNSMLKHPYATFRFGYREYNGVDRTTWYDDVAVATSRIGCL